MSKKTIRMDSTQIVQLLKCPQLHDFASVLNLTSIHADRTALDRGTIMHGLLERYYRKIWEREPLKAANYAIGCLTDLKKTVNLKDEDYAALTIRFLEYTNHYAKDSVAVYTSPDGKPAIELGFSGVLYEDDNYLFVLEGRIDLITEISGQLVIWDHKYQGREYLLYGRSIQSLDYRLAVNNRTFMYNYIRGHEKIKANTFERKMDSISKQALENWKTKLIKIYKAYADGLISLSEAYPNQSCTDVGFGKKCPFTQICEEPYEPVRKLLLARDFVQKPEWLPWSLEENGN